MKTYINKIQRDVVDMPEGLPMKETLGTHINEHKYLPFTDDQLKESLEEKVEKECPVCELIGYKCVKHDEYLNANPHANTWFKEGHQHGRLELLQEIEEWVNSFKYPFQKSDLLTKLNSLKTK